MQKIIDNNIYASAAPLETAVSHEHANHMRMLQKYERLLSAVDQETWLNLKLQPERSKIEGSVRILKSYKIMYQGQQR